MVTDVVTDVFAWWWEWCEDSCLMPTPVFGLVYVCVCDGGWGVAGRQVLDFRDPCQPTGSAAGMRDVADQFSGSYDLLSGEESGRGPGDALHRTVPKGTPVSEGVTAILTRILRSERPLVVPRPLPGTVTPPVSADFSLAVDVARELDGCKGDAFSCLARLLSGDGERGGAGAGAMPTTPPPAVVTAAVHATRDLRGGAGAGSEPGRASPAASPAFASDDLASPLLNAWWAPTGTGAGAGVMGTGAGAGAGGAGAGAVGGGCSLPSPVATSASSLLFLKSNTVLVDPSPGAGGALHRETNVVPLPPEACSLVTIATWVRVDALPPCTNRLGETVAPFRVQSRVWGNYRATGSWYAGRITAVNPDGTFGITYDDGDTEANVVEECISDRKVCAWTCVAGGEGAPLRCVPL